VSILENNDFEAKVVSVSAKLAVSIVEYMDLLIERGYYSSREDIVRQAIIDLFIDKFEISLLDLEPDLFEFPSIEEIDEAE
jgi:hypothetical protein